MSETALMRATRDEIRLHPTWTGPPDKTRQVEIEFDQRAPATAGDLYVMVLYGGVQEGPDHDENNGFIDKLYGVDVVIAIRSPRKPRDRQRDLWLDLTSSFAVYQRHIELRVDFSYALLTAANVFITAEDINVEGFIEPLKFAGAGPIREAPAEVFDGASGETAAALIRTIQFRGARRIEYRERPPE